MVTRKQIKEYGKIIAANLDGTLLSLKKTKLSTGKECIMYAVSDPEAENMESHIYIPVEQVEERVSKLQIK